MGDRIEVDVSELNTLAVDLSSAPRHVGREVNAVMRRTTYDIEATAKMFAPVDTGALRSSIGHSDLRTLGHSGAMEVLIGPTVDYADFVEFGTSRQAPRAFMGPALDRHTPAFVAALEDIVERAVDNPGGMP